MPHERPGFASPVTVSARLRHAVCCALLSAPLATALPAQELQAELRTWTSKSGKSSTRARLWKVTEEDGQRRLHLMKEGGFGVSFSMAWKALSPADVAYVERVTADRRRAFEAAGTEVAEIRGWLSPAAPGGPAAIDRAALERIEFLASELLLVDATDAAALEAMRVVSELERRAASPEHLVSLCRGPIARDVAATPIDALPEELQGVWWIDVRSGDGGATVERVEEGQRPAGSLRLGRLDWQTANPGDGVRALRRVARLAAVDGLATHMMIPADDAVWIVHGPTPERRVLLRKLDPGLRETGRAVFQIKH